MRLIPAIERHEGIVRLARGAAGKLLLLALFAVLLRLHFRPFWAETTALLAATTFLPRWRRPLIAACTIFWLTRHTTFRWDVAWQAGLREGVAEHVDYQSLKRVVVPLVLGLGLVLLRSVREAPRGFAARHPVTVLVSTELALALVAHHAPLHGSTRVFLWAVVVVLGAYLWYFALSLIDGTTRDSPGWVMHLGSWMPFWIGTSTSVTPYPRGVGQLRRIEAESAGELAVTQLKGLKLIAWALVLWALQEAMHAVAKGAPSVVTGALFDGRGLGIPAFEETFRAHLAGQPFAWWTCWASLTVMFLSNLLDLAIAGHVIIACCRMAGFRALRNTWRPLEARTIAEFWNRYYFYFKELMVVCFFLPTYLRLPRRYPRLRLFLSTLAAAGFGNVLYHYLRDVKSLAELGPWEAWTSFRVYWIYGLALGTAIALSQLRHRGRPEPRGWLRRRILAPGCVLLFYCLISVFDDPDRSLTVADHATFLLRLVGL